HVLKLNGGVPDVKALFEHLVKLDQNVGALRRGNVDDGHVAGQCAGVRADAPDVQVVYIDHSLDVPHARANLRERDTAGRSFQENIEGLVDDVHAGPENQRGYEHRKNGVDPVPAGEQNPGASGDNSGG